jgi:hypothetical protein
LRFILLVRFGFGEQPSPHLTSIPPGDCSGEREIERDRERERERERERKRDREGEHT